MPKNTEITDIDINDSPLSLTIEKFILNPKRITANSRKFLETNFGALSSLEKKLGIFFGIFFINMPIIKEMIKTSKIFDSNINV